MQYETKKSQGPGVPGEIREEHEVNKKKILIVNGFSILSAGGKEPVVGKDEKIRERE